MDFRLQCGEKIIRESWLMKHLWDVTTPSGGPLGLATVPKKLRHKGVKRLIERALRAQGIRTKLEDGKNRHPFQTDHGFRKYFKTRCELGGMRSINIEGLMNHSTGVSDSYYRPQEKEILEDYLKATKSLTISENNNSEIEKQTRESRFTEFQNKHSQEISSEIIIFEFNVILMTSTESHQRLISSPNHSGPLFTWDQLSVLDKTEEGKQQNP